MSLVANEDFQHILRVLNTNVDGKQKIMFALTSIKGIGRRFANIVCKKADVDMNKRAGELTAQELDNLMTIVANPRQFKIPDWFLNRQKDYKDGKYSQVVSNALDMKLRDDLERLKKIRNHRGLRHYWGLRVRGQHTKTTGRRGKTVDEETVIVLYCSTGNVNAESIQLFAELVDYRDTSTWAENPHHGLTKYNNLNPGPRLQIPPVVIGTNADGEGLDNDGHSNHKGVDFNDLNLDEVSNDIDNEGVNEGENVHAPFVGNLSRGIIIRNDPRAYILSLNLDARHASEFPESLNIIPSHLLMANSKLEELYIGQQFAYKEDCVFAIKRYSMKVLVEYKVVKSMLTLYVREC
ncbi:hypothetical protein PVK06_020317 [Gossypium arboreum]|uniref:40S ribosomal protein S18 n=1 Tax=Gossypium arboreum TaxID=29729 RepID=A0ABR0PMQ3_GOSAR|nr:hypothetical protein PVK06_020317 [Gossypium arboreum]